MRHELAVEIEKLREMMMLTGCKKGLASHETIEISRRLDLLMNEFETYEKDSTGKKIYGR